jgi:hypothetical protein
MGVGSQVHAVSAAPADRRETTENAHTHRPGYVQFTLGLIRANTGQRGPICLHTRGNIST